MAFRAGAQKSIAGIRAGLSRFGRDRRGVAAIEFAFIAPLLLAMYFLTMEVTQAIEVNKKLGRVSAMVGDLITREGSVTKEDLDAIMKIADSTLLPYHRSMPKIVVTGIRISDKEPLQAIVQWSRKVDGGVYSADAKNGDLTTVSDDTMNPGWFVVRVKSDLAYQPVITWSSDGKSLLGLAAAFDSLSMSETAYLKARMTGSVTCSNC